MNKGFTLIEIIITIVVLAIVSLFTFSFITESAKTQFVDYRLNGTDIIRASFYCFTSSGWPGNSEQCISLFFLFRQQEHWRTHRTILPSPFRGIARQLLSLLRCVRKITAATLYLSVRQTTWEEVLTGTIMTLSNKRGAALIILIIVITITGLIGAGILSMMGAKQRSYAFQLQSYQAYMLAHAGVEFASDMLMIIRMVLYQFPIPIYLHQHFYP